MPSITTQKQPKSKKELIFNAILYEIIMSTSASAILKLINGDGFIDTFFLSMILSFIALFWNMIFNYLFDRYLLKKRGHIVKSMSDRLLHGIGFETVFAFFALIFIMLYKQVGIIEALKLEAFFLIFALIFTIVFTYIYDMCRALILKKVK